MTSVYVLRAVNTADFNEPDITVVGTSSEAAERRFKEILNNRWDKYLDEDDKDFYKTLDNYEDSWNQQIDLSELVS
jgi:hypothetical protein